MTIPCTLLDDFDHLGYRGNAFLSAWLWIDALVRCFTNLHLLSRGVKEIHDHLIVNLEVLTSHVEFNSNHIIIKLGKDLW